MSEMLGNAPEQQEPCLVSLCSTTPDEGDSLESDEHGPNVELCFTPGMSNIMLDQTQFAQLEPNMVATMRLYVSSAAKRAVVVKEDGLLTKADIAAHPKEVSEALCTEFKIWLDNRCLEMYDLSQASNIMTSRYVYEWKFVKAGTEN
eukprot:1307626-Pyramimonas_sp.AAC.1